MRMSTEAKARLNAFNAKQTDWYTVCPLCSAELRGTIEELQSHRCVDGLGEV